MSKTNVFERSSIIPSRLAFTLLISIISMLVPSVKIVGKTTIGTKALSQNASVHWLYVLDTKRRAGGDEILQVNAETGQVAKTIPVGFSPDFILSPDVSRAYVVSSLKASAGYILQILNLPDGNVLGSETVVDRADHTAYVPPRTLAVSPDGSLVYVMTLHWTPARGNVAQKNEYSVAVYDGAQGGFLGRVSLPESCDGNYLLALPNALYVLCYEGNALSIFSTSSNGLNSQRRTVQLPPAPKYIVGSIVPTSDTATSVHPALVGAIASPDGRTLTVATSYMRLIQLDTSTEKVIGQKEVRNDRWAMPETLLASPDGNRLYIGVGPISQLNRALGIGEILVLDAHTLETLGTINTRGLFDTLSMSRDGQWLYATSYSTGAIHLIDTSQGRESRVLSVGVSPVRCWG